MKKLGYIAFVFLVPILIIAGVVEYLLRSIPNDYQTKNNQIALQKDSITTLILGSSHTLYGVNPDFINQNAFNGANISQTIDIDYTILKQSIFKLPKLKNVVIRVSHTTLFELLPKMSEAWRMRNYYIYYDNLDLPWSLFNRFEIFTTHFKLNLKRLFDFYIDDKSSLNCLPNGWNTSYKTSAHRSLAKSAKIAVIRHNIKDFKYHKQCKSYLKMIIDLCEQHNINVILITPPACNEYINQLYQPQLNKTISFCKELDQTHKNCIYINYFLNDSFTISDFFDADHLNHSGAEKLSNDLNKYLREK